MTGLVVQPTSTAHWHQLVGDAQKSCAVSLDEDMESYLVFLLMRFVACPELAASVLSLAYLEGLATSGRLRVDRLRDVGDRCLLFSGLFPGRARRRRVRVGYFVAIGQGAYAELAQVAGAHGGLFARLRERFVAMMDVLAAMRGGAPVDALTAFETWQDTGSKAARAALTGVVQGQPILVTQPATHKM